MINPQLAPHSTRARSCQRGTGYAVTQGAMSAKSRCSACNASLAYAKTHASYMYLHMHISIRMRMIAYVCMHVWMLHCVCVWLERVLAEIWLWSRCCPLLMVGLRVNPRQRSK